MAKKTKRNTTTGKDEVWDDEDDDSEDKFEPVNEKGTVAETKPTYGATLEDDAKEARPDEGWCTAADAPPNDTVVQIETSGEKCDGKKVDGVWYRKPVDAAPDAAWDPQPVQITRWRPIAEAK